MTLDFLIIALLKVPLRTLTHLLVIRAQHDPATESIAQVNHASTAAEAQDFGKGNFHGQN